MKLIAKVELKGKFVESLGIRWWLAARYLSLGAKAVLFVLTTHPMFTKQGQVDICHYYLKHGNNTLVTIHPVEFQLRIYYLAIYAPKRDSLCVPSRV